MIYLFWQNETINILITSSLLRSGSTYLGELLSSRESSNFIFEPVCTLESKSQNENFKSVTRILNELFRCENSKENNDWYCECKRCEEAIELNKSCKNV